MASIFDPAISAERLTRPYAIGTPSQVGPWPFVGDDVVSKIGIANLKETKMSVSEGLGSDSLEPASLPEDSLPHVVEIPF